MGRDATDSNTSQQTHNNLSRLLEHFTVEHCLKDSPSPRSSKCFLPVVSGLLMRGGQIVRQMKKEAGHKPCHPCFSEAAGMGAGPQSSGKAPRFSRWE